MRSMVVGVLRKRSDRGFPPSTAFHAVPLPTSGEGYFIG